MNTKEVSLILDELLQPYMDIPVVLAISGGPDSISLLHTVVSWYKERCLDLSNIIICHYQHRVRDDGTDLSLVSKQYPELYHVYASSISGSTDERNLRDQRRDFLYSVMASFGASCVLTGHNLTDRLETTVMNIQRGCSLKGLINMQSSQKRWVYKYFTSGKQIVILRPLLSFRKSDLENLCVTNSREYVVDPTNIDASVSQRNKVRSILVSKALPGYFRRRLTSLYNTLSDRYFSKISEPRKLLTSPLWGKDVYMFCSTIPRTGHELTYNMSTLGIYKGTTYANLESIFSLLTGSKNGFVYFSGWYIFKSGDIVYYIKTKSKFWEREYVESSEIITGGKYTLGGFERDIPDNLCGGVLRLPRSGDKRGSKSLAKYFLNNKVPIFWRRSIPVVEMNDEIQAIFPLENLGDRVA